MCQTSSVRQVVPLVDLLELLDLLLGGLPVALGVGLEEGLDHVAESVRVLVQHLLADGRVGDVGVVSVLVDKIVNGTRRRAPAVGVAQALGDLAHALVAALQGRLVELRVQELGARVQTDLRGERAHLRVRRGGVGDQRGGLLAVLLGGTTCLTLPV